MVAGARIVAHALSLSDSRLRHSYMETVSGPGAPEQCRSGYLPDGGELTLETP